jgi:hypothetical protein
MMNKKTFSLISLLIIVSALIISCSISSDGEAPVEEAAAPVAEAPADVAQAESAPPAEGEADAPAPGESGEGSMFIGAGNAVGSLAMGTLSLQDTDTPVTPEQAALLLPLWEQLKEAMSQEEYDSAAVDDLTAQIEAQMIEVQLAAIESMDPETMMEWMQESGAMPEFAGGEMLEGGERPEGEPPADGEPPAEMPEGTRQAPAEGEMGPGGQPGGPGFGRGGTFMIDAVIEYLSSLV